MRKVLFIPFITLILFITFIAFASAYDYYPGRNINMEGIWNLSNASVLEGKCLKLNGTMFCAITTSYTNVAFTNQSTSWGIYNLTAANFFGYLNWSWLQNVPSYVKDWTTTIQSMINANLTDYYKKSEVDSNLSSVNLSLSNKINDVNLTLNNKIDNVNSSLDNANVTLTNRINNVNLTLNNKIDNVNSSLNDTNVTLTNKINGINVSLSLRIDNNNQTAVNLRIDSLNLSIIDTNLTLTNRINGINSSLSIRIDNLNQTQINSLISDLNSTLNDTNVTLTNIIFLINNSLSLRIDNNNLTLVNLRIDNLNTSINNTNETLTDYIESVNSSLSLRIDLNNLTAINLRADNLNQSIIDLNTTMGIINTSLSGQVILKVMPGNCPAGQVTMNTTTSGVQCVPQSAGNATWNESHADKLYYSITNPLNFVNSSGTVDYTNVAFINKSQVFSGQQNFSGINNSGDYNGTINCELVKGSQGALCSNQTSINESGNIIAMFANYVGIDNETANKNWTQVVDTMYSAFKVYWINQTLPAVLQINNTIEQIAIGINNNSLSTAYLHSQATTGTIHGLTWADVVTSVSATNMGASILNNVLTLIVPKFADQQVNITSDVQHNSMNTTKQSNSSNSIIFGLTIDNATRIKSNLSFTGPICRYWNSVLNEEVTEWPCTQ